MTMRFYQSGRTILASPVPLATLSPAPAGAVADAEISFGPLPTPDARCIAEKPHFRAFADRSCLLRSPGGSRFYLRQGRSIRAELSPDCTLVAEMAWLEGPAVTLLHHQRGELPLHAAAIAIGDVALGIAGDSGAGKSTSVRALVQRGHRFLRDDRLILDPADPRVSPGPARLLLKQDAARWFGDGPSHEVAPMQPDGKIMVTPALSAELPPMPLAAIILLPVEAAEDWMVENPSPAHAVPLLHRQVSRVRLAGLMGCLPDLFRMLTGLAAAVPVFRLRGPRRLEDLTGLAACLEGLADRLRRGRS